jgi:uncharacterized protein YdaU (DUF1376 family)
MTRPWMPLYVADYRADTAHLGALEHGIYLLLIMHYWQTGGLPDDDRQLARIGCATDTEWKRAKPIVGKFFAAGWKHGRIEKELARAAEISSKRRDAAEQRYRPKAASADAFAEQVQTQPLSPPQEPIEILNGQIGEKRWTSPRHGATSSAKGRVYIHQGTPEWDAYAADFRSVNFREPEPNRHGGKWFKTLGEASGD